MSTTDMATIVNSTNTEEKEFKKIEREIDEKGFFAGNSPYLNITAGRLCPGPGATGCFKAY